MYEFKFDEDDYEMYEIMYAENPIKILVDDQFDKDWSPVGCRPYYQLRGKRVSEQQAFDIICGTDRLFSHPFLNLEGSITSLNFGNNWFSRNRLSRKGWIHPNGIIGTNSYMTKYPTVDEFVHEWAVYLYDFPFLDLIVGITWWDEMSPERWEMTHKYFRNQNFLNEIDYLKYDDFCDNLEAEIWVHDGKIEIIDEKRAIEVYKQYEELYEEKDHRVYCRGYYEDFHPDVTTMEYLKKCLATYGITDAEKILSEKLYAYDLEQVNKLLSSN